jgi:hypothetical protein
MVAVMGDVSYAVTFQGATVRPIKGYEDLSLDKPFHVIYKVSKLAYRI